MVHYIWDAALLLHLVQNLVLLLSCRVIRKWIVWGGLGLHIPRVIPAPSPRLKVSFLKKSKLVCNTTDTHRDNPEMALTQSPSQTLLPCHKHITHPTRSQSPPRPRMFPALHNAPVLQVRHRHTQGCHPGTHPNPPHRRRGFEMGFFGFGFCFMQAKFRVAECRGAGKAETKQITPKTGAGHQLQAAAAFPAMEGSSPAGEANQDGSTGCRAGRGLV